SLNKGWYLGERSRSARNSDRRRSPAASPISSFRCFDTVARSFPNVAPATWQQLLQPVCRRIPMLLMRLGRILIFPIKSLDGIQLDEVAITKGGILENDRIYAIFDEQDRVVNGKRTPRVHTLRCEFDPGLQEVRFWTDNQPVQFCLDASSAIDRWLSE